MQTTEQLTQCAMSVAASGKPWPTRTTRAGQTDGANPAGQPPMIPHEVLVLVGQVFTRLAALYPRTWESAFPTAEVMSLSRRELAQELATWPALPTRQVVERAMSGLKRSGSTWPPTIPVLIAALAPTPEDFGMPVTAEAWREACAHAHEPRRHRWSHEAVRMAGNAVGWWDLTHTTAQSKWPRLEKRFSQHYQALVNRVMAGDPLEERHLLESDRHRSKAELAERAGREQAQQQVEAAGLPLRMDARQGLAALRAAAGRV